MTLLGSPMNQRITSTVWQPRSNKRAAAGQLLIGEPGAAVVEPVVERGHVGDARAHHA